MTPLASLTESRICFGTAIFGEPARRRQHGVFAEHVDRRGDRLVRAVEAPTSSPTIARCRPEVGYRWRRIRRYRTRRRNTAPWLTVISLWRRSPCGRSDGPAACAAIPTPRIPVSRYRISSAARRECACARTSSSLGRGCRRRSSRCSRCRDRRWRWPSGARCSTAAAHRRLQGSRLVLAASCRIRQACRRAPPLR